jgi:LCP family protein required for cell wall assembly
MTVPKIKYKKPLVITGIVVLLILGIIASYFIILKIGEVRLRNSLSNTDDTLSDDAYSDEADAYHNGNAYYYNKDLVNILFIGVDKENLSDNNGKQADAIYLVSADFKQNKANIMAISRNTLTDIEIYDMNGEYLDTENKQICLSYAYGKDDVESSNLTSKAVSRLLYDIPINGYYTVFMDSIGDIVDSVGGVAVTVPEDMTEYSPEWKKGAKVKINGEKAMLYLTYRQDSSEQRLQRQKQFISSFVSSAKKAVAKNISLPLNMYKKLAKNTVTDVDATSAVYLASEIMKAEFEIIQIPGKVGFDGTYETFEADESALYEQVLDVFYKVKK